MKLINEPDAKGSNRDLAYCKTKRGCLTPGLGSRRTDRDNRPYHGLALRAFVVR
jgi:hypothetical protein